MALFDILVLCFLQFARKSSSWTALTIYRGRSSWGCWKEANFQVGCFCFPDALLYPDESCDWFFKLLFSQVSFYCLWDFYLWSWYYTQNTGRGWGGEKHLSYKPLFVWNYTSITLWKLISVTDFFWSLVVGSWWTCCFPFWSQNSPIAHYWLGILARLFFVDFLESSLSSTSVGWSFCRYNFYYHAFYLSPLISSVSFLFQRNYQ